ncbi:MAG: site-specific integrase [Rhodospirillales bacterium]|nr:site-specific integrase [Rhodospirillales bacterium]
MAERKRITLTDVRGLQPGQTLWDGAVAGFYARRQQSEAVRFGLFYRTETGRQRWQTIGRFGSPWTPDTARTEARRLLGEVVRGRDPAGEKEASRRAVTVAELCALYLADAEAGRLLVRGGKPKKPLTLASDRGRIEGHIIPLLGSMKVASVTREDVARFMHQVAEGATVQQHKTKPRGVSRVRGGRGVATRTIGLLGAIFAYAIEHRMRRDNPAHGIRKFAENKRDRRLSEDEYRLLGKALREATEGCLWPPAVSCARCLALTGWRSGEALALRWQDLDLARRTAVLPDTKTGRSMRPLSHAACEVLSTMPRIGMGALVFPASRGDGPMLGFKKFFRRIVVAGGLPKAVTPHVLRHSFASLAADLGYSEPTIGALIGHKGTTITSRYVHSADAVLLAAADAVATRTAELLGDAVTAGAVVELRRA